MKHFCGFSYNFYNVLTPKSITKIVPAALIALFFVTILATILNLNIPTIGEIPSSYQTLFYHLLIF